MLEQVIEKFGSLIVLEKNMTVEAEVFSQLFAECENLSYDELVRVDRSRGYGYYPYIERWREQGLIE